MSDIRRRLNKAEKTLGIEGKPKKPFVICIRPYEKNPPEPDLPENVEEWITYQKQLQEHPTLAIIVLSTRNEVKAREKQKVEDREGL